MKNVLPVVLALLAFESLAQAQVWRQPSPGQYAGVTVEALFAAKMLEPILRKATPTQAARIARLDQMKEEMDSLASQIEIKDNPELVDLEKRLVDAKIGQGEANGAIQAIEMDSNVFNDKPTHINRGDVDFTITNRAGAEEARVGYDTQVKVLSDRIDELKAKAASGGVENAALIRDRYTKLVADSDSLMEKIAAAESKGPRFKYFRYGLGILVGIDVYNGANHLIHLGDGNFEMIPLKLIGQLLDLGIDAASEKYRSIQKYEN